MSDFSCPICGKLHMGKGWLPLLGGISVYVHKVDLDSDNGRPKGFPTENFIQFGACREAAEREAETDE